MARKIKASTDNSGWVEPKKKIRKKRKPMTEEQKQAAAARLEKAREARAAKNPDYGLLLTSSSVQENLFLVCNNSFLSSCCIYEKK